MSGMNTVSAFCITTASFLAMLSTASESATYSFPFESDLKETSAALDATAAGDYVFLDEQDRRFLRLQPNAIITLDNTLGQELSFTTSFEISLDFRAVNLEPIQECIYRGPFLSTLRYDLGATYQSGFNFEIEANPSPYSEGGYYTNFALEAVGYEGIYGLFGEYTPDSNLANWRTLTIRFELDRGLYIITLGSLTLNKPLPTDFDIDVFKEGLFINPFVISGLDNRYNCERDLLLDIANLTISAPAAPVDSDLDNAFQALVGHLDGSAELSEDALDGFANLITAKLYLASSLNAIEDSVFAFTDLYESLMPPMYEDGREYEFAELPPLQRVLQTTQGWIFETQFVPGNLDAMAGVKFEHHEVAPGKVADGTTRITSATVDLNGTYQADIAAELTDQSRVVRPTGYYLAAGDIATVRVPAAATELGLSVIVGHHFRNMDYDYIGYINRFPDISAEYPLDAPEIKIANPFGGGIYLKVPEGTDAGIIAMTLENVVRSAYFSWRAGARTSVSDWLSLAESTGAPWVDFESDKFMFTVPTDKLAGITNPDDIMIRWDEIIDNFDRVGGRSWTRPRAEYYTFDTRLVTPAYGAGYPMVVPEWEAYRNHPEEGWDPLMVTEFKPARTFLHESGHNQLHPTMSYGTRDGECLGFEAETVVHNLAVGVYSEVYGLPLDDAFRQSAYQFLSLDQAAFDWIITENFRANQPMYEEPGAPLEFSEQLRYQHRGHAKYTDIVRLFGLDGLADVHAEFYDAGSEQVATSECSSFKMVVDRDDYIRAASQALNTNMTPLFHFWGINPSTQLADELQSYPASEAIYDLLVHYRNEVAPKTLDDFLVYADQFPKQDYQYPRYPWYESQFDEAFAAAIDDQFDLLITTYFADAGFGNNQDPMGHQNLFLRLLDWVRQIRNGEP